MSAAVEVLGGGFAGLLRAVDESRRGGRVEFVEPRLRAGGSMATESFLSPFRFNLGPSLVRRPPLPSLPVLEPEVLLEVDGSTLTRAAARTGGGALRTAFGLLLGIDPGAADAEARLATACSEVDDLVLVCGGNGVAVACLLDELVAGGSTVVEGVGDVDVPATRGDGLGICRLFLGLRSGGPDQRALATAVGFRDEQSLATRVDALRSGDTQEPLGFLVSNAHLDENLVDGGLRSFVWQGVLPFGADVSRAAYTERVVAALDLDPDDLIFRLLWLPEDTGEAL